MMSKKRMPVESSNATAYPPTVSLATFFFSCMFFSDRQLNIRCFLCDCVYSVESVILFSILFRIVFLPVAVSESRSLAGPLDVSL